MSSWTDSIHPLTLPEILDMGGSLAQRLTIRKLLRLRKLLRDSGHHTNTIHQAPTAIVGENRVSSTFGANVSTVTLRAFLGLKRKLPMPSSAFRQLFSSEDFQFPHRGLPVHQLETADNIHVCIQNKHQSVRISVILRGNEYFCGRHQDGQSYRSVTAPCTAWKVRTTLYRAFERQYLPFDRSSPFLAWSACPGLSGF
jgi:hypothetical protein